jgi:hypothetical protein
MVHQVQMELMVRRACKDHKVLLDRQVLLVQMALMVH